MGQKVFREDYASYSATRDVIPTNQFMSIFLFYLGILSRRWKIFTYVAHGAYFECAFVPVFIAYAEAYEVGNGCCDDETVEDLMR